MRHRRVLALALGATVLGAVATIASCSAPSEPTKPDSDPKPPAAPRLPPLFEDVTPASGLNFTYRNGEDTANHYAILESLGGGVALIDFDGDGLLDVFVTGGGAYAGPGGKQIVGHPCKLFRNLGGFKFLDVTDAIGLGTLASGKPWFYSHGVAVADYDRDGWPDLLVTGWGAVALFRNVPVDAAGANKGRRFQDATEAAGLSRGITWATSAAFADLDGDGFPELYACQYVDWSWDNHPKCQYDGTTPDVCPPRNFSGLTHKLYRNTGRGSFVDISTEVGLKPGASDASKGLGVLMVDIDGDGKPDVYVANDTVDKFLYMNRSTAGRVVLEERGLMSNAARDDQGAANGSMGLDAGDPFRLGTPALWVTNYENELHGLYQFQGTGAKPFFGYRTVSAGIGAMGRRYVGWGTAFVDVDLDGWEDLVVANGHAIRNPLGKDSARKQLPVLLLNEQGRFSLVPERLGSYAQTPHVARGLAVGDLDNDGRPDLVISQVNEPVALLRGTGGADRHWLGVELVGEKHACVVGAKVTFESASGRQTRFAKGGGSYASSPDRRSLFGLGPDESGKLTVTWPDGKKQTFDAVRADRYYRLTAGTEKLVPAMQK